MEFDIKVPNVVNSIVEVSERNRQRTVFISFSAYPNRNPFANTYFKDKEYFIALKNEFVKKGFCVNTHDDIETKNAMYVETQLIDDRTREKIENSIICIILVSQHYQYNAYCNNIAQYICNLRSQKHNDQNNSKFEVVFIALESDYTIVNQQTRSKGQYKIEWLADSPFIFQADDLINIHSIINSPLEISTNIIDLLNKRLLRNNTVYICHNHILPSTNHRINELKSQLCANGYSINEPNIELLNRINNNFNDIDKYSLKAIQDDISNSIAFIICLDESLLENEFCVELSKYAASLMSTNVCTFTLDDMSICNKSLTNYYNKTIKSLLKPRFEIYFAVLNEDFSPSVLNALLPHNSAQACMKRLLLQDTVRNVTDSGGNAIKWFPLWNDEHCMAAADAIARLLSTPAYCTNHSHLRTPTLTGMSRYPWDTSTHEYVHNIKEHTHHSSNAYMDTTNAYSTPNIRAKTIFIAYDEANTTSALCIKSIFEKRGYLVLQYNGYRFTGLVVGISGNVKESLAKCILCILLVSQDFRSNRCCKMVADYAATLATGRHRDKRPSTGTGGSNHRTQSHQSLPSARFEIALLIVSRTFSPGITIDASVFGWLSNYIKAFNPIWHPIWDKSQYSHAVDSLILSINLCNLKTKEFAQRSDERKGEKMGLRSQWEWHRNGGTWDPKLAPLGGSSPGGKTKPGPTTNPKSRPVSR